MSTVYFTSTLSLSTPKGIAVDPVLKQVLISDSGNNKVVLCTLDGLKQVTTKSSYNSNNFSSPNGITYYNGYFYICDTGSHTVVRLRARDLAYKGVFGVYGSSGSATTKLSSPAGITHDKKYLYITNGGSNIITKLNLENLTYNSNTSSINGAFNAPTGIVYKKEGGEALFIADKVGNRIVKCQTDFTYIEQNSTNITSPLGLTYIRDMVHVCNGGSGDDDIIVLASDGLASQTALTDTAITLSTPDGIASYKDSIFVCDSGNNRVTVWRAYNPRDSFTPATPMKFGGVTGNNPMMIVGKDTVVVGATQEYGTPNRWKEENTNNYGLGAVEEDTVSSSWTEES